MVGWGLAFSAFTPAYIRLLYACGTIFFIVVFFPANFTHIWASSRVVKRLKTQPTILMGWMQFCKAFIITVIAIKFPAYA